MNCSKLQQFCRIISYRLLHRNLSVLQKTYICEKLTKNISRSIFSVPVNLHIKQKHLSSQSNVNFSTSKFVSADNNTMVENQKCYVHYSDVLKAQNDKDTLLIDVREKEEVNKSGTIPGSINIPMKEVANTLTNLSEKDFETTFQRKKPSKDTMIIFFCRSGKRSGMVYETIQKLGYKKACNYIGGWLDWESKHKG